MAFQVADRVKETSTTTGTGTLDLGGAPDTYETFVAGIGNGNTTYYAIANRAANEWEVGIGTVTDAATDTLSRDTVISSSNSDALVNFSAGTKDVICTLPSEKSFVIDNSSNTTITSNLAVTGGATFTANVSLGDNDRLRFGASQDLQIYHDPAANHSYISEGGTGDLIIEGGNIRLENGSSEYYIRTYNNAQVELYYDNAEKLATTSTGISVTGTVVESSSLAYKENVQPLEFNDAIYNVNAVKYDRKDGSSKNEVGVIAEELYEVLPDLVECKDGKPDAVKYTKMTMYLLEALKKQNQEIQLLKEKLNG